MLRRNNKAKLTDETKLGSKPSKTATPKSDSNKVHQQPDLSKTIEKLAYERWQSRGCPHGDDWSDWLEAESQI